MQCPKCGFLQEDHLTECRRCGVIFNKIRHADLLDPETSSSELADVMSDEKSYLFHFLKILLFEVKESSLLSVAGRGLLLVILLLLSFKLVAASIASNTSGNSLIHLINLPFHEAGHVLFRPFGRFMTSLGGSLFQLMIPLICFGVLLIKTRDTFGASVCFWWFGENFVDLAPYINDAQAGVLPLLGGNTGRMSPYGFHDWEFILTESGLLQSDHIIAMMAHGLGSIIMITAIVWGCYLIYLQVRKTNKGL